MSAARATTGRSPQPIAVRVLTAADHDELERLAGVDSSQPINASRLLGADVEGRLAAAISLDDGSVVADPFRPTSAAVELLRLRARQLGGSAGPSSSAGRLRRILRGLARGHAHAGLAGSPPGAGGRLLEL